MFHGQLQSNYKKKSKQNRTKNIGPVSYPPAQRQIEIQKRWKCGKTTLYVIDHLYRCRKKKQFPMNPEVKKKKKRKNDTAEQF